MAAAARRRGCQAPPNQQSRCSRRLERHHAADCPRDRGSLCHERSEIAVVHRPAQYQPRSARSGRSEAAHPPAGGSVSKRWPPDHGESGFFKMTRGRETVLGTAKFITLEAAKKMAEAGEAEARKNGWNVAIAIVDAGGGLILF